ncbi:HNH endonuclease [Xanthomonas translucens]|nr:HNH endonuclease [Xanthomonas translucens]
MLIRSTDSTENGIALCVLHHRAYDKNIISIDEATSPRPE